ncbi:hypothetical protein V6N13_081683 [Hibiscus sabdariffa]|uniref:Uncharacterized protein n=1 Tax=Hibiscus sabdariffa TaxID=183260 RepID=A0ABR2DD49_9ROSI
MTHLAGKLREKRENNSWSITKGTIDQDVQAGCLTPELPWGYKFSVENSNHSKWCIPYITRTGTCRSALTNLTEIAFLKWELTILPREIEGCWALITLCFEPIVERIGCSTLCLPKGSLLDPGAPPWGLKKEGDKGGHTRGCIVGLPESGSCGSDRSRGCSVDFS